MTQSADEPDSRADRGDAVVDLTRVVAEDPDVATRERPVRRSGRDAVVVSRNDVVGLTGDAVLDAPLPLARRYSRTLDLVRLGVPFRGAEPGQRRVVELLHQVVARRSEVEVEPPVDVVV